MHGAFLLGSCRKITGAKCDINMSREAVAKQLQDRSNYGQTVDSYRSRQTIVKTIFCFSSSRHATEPGSISFVFITFLKVKVRFKTMGPGSGAYRGDGGEWAPAQAHTGETRGNGPLHRGTPERRGDEALLRGIHGD